MIFSKVTPISSRPQSVCDAACRAAAIRNRTLTKLAERLAR
jgi:hypothetical protein